MEEAVRYCLGCMENIAGAPVCPHCAYVAGKPAESVLHLTPGVILKQRYLTGRVLGDGGFGITYIGRDLVLDSKVAIKEYFPSGVAVRTRGEPHVFPASSSFRTDYQFGMERFLDEARLVRKFKDHPNIVRVEDFFPENDTAYMILEFLDGITLEKYLDKHGGRIEWQNAVNCMVWVMDALREVHAAGVLHRDISPDNIFLVRSGHVKVIDFGAARQAMSQKSVNLSVILKHGYAPFEQYESKGRQGPWTDVYAASATLYRAITGKMPPAAPDRFTKDTLEKPSDMGIAIPADKEAVLWKGLALRVEDRYQDMLSIENALLNRGAAAAPAPLPKPLPMPMPIPTPVPVPKFPLAWVIGAVAAIMIAAIAYYASTRPSKPPTITAFRAEPQNVLRGSKTTLTWDVADAETVEVVGIGVQRAKGNLAVSPVETVTYTLVAKPRRGPEVRKQVEVAVSAPASARIVRFEAAPDSVAPGAMSLLTWQVENGNEVRLDGQAVSPSGSKQVQEQSTKSFTLEARGPDGLRQESQTTLNVVATFTAIDRNTIPKPKPDPRPDPNPKPIEPAPRILSFTAHPSTITAGETVVLSWSTANASRVMLLPQPGAVAPSGEMRIEPRGPSRFNLTAQDASGREISAGLYVHVNLATIPNPQPMPSGTSWPIAHDHEGMTSFNPYDKLWNHCEGTLRLIGRVLKYETRFPGDSFTAPLSDIDEIKMNRMGIRGMKAFHIKLNSGRKFNFVSRDSPDRIVSVIQQAMR